MAAARPVLFAAAVVVRLVDFAAGFAAATVRLVADDLAAAVFGFDADLAFDAAFAVAALAVLVCVPVALRAATVLDGPAFVDDEDSDVVAATIGVRATLVVAFLAGETLPGLDRRAETVLLGFEAPVSATDAVPAFVDRAVALPDAAFFDAAIPPALL